MVYVAIAALFAATVIYIVRVSANTLREMTDEWRLERIALLNRIQAPEPAVKASLSEHVPPSPPAVGFDDDDGFHQAKERLNGDSGRG